MYASIKILISYWGPPQECLVFYNNSNDYGNFFNQGKARNSNGLNPHNLSSLHEFELPNANLEDLLKEEIPGYTKMVYYGHNGSNINGQSVPLYVAFFPHKGISLDVESVIKAYGLKGSQKH